MSIEAIAWTLNSAPDVPPALVATLLGLANHADPAGKGALPTQQRLAHYTRKSERTVRRDLEQLEALKLIRRGDQRRAAYLPADRRPVVWDLALERARPIPAHLDVHAEPRSGTTADHPQASYPQALRPVDNQEDAHDRPDAHGPTPTRPGGRPRPPARPRSTSDNTNRGDAHVRHAFRLEEVNTSPNLAAARKLLTALNHPWSIGRRTIEQLAPTVAAALDAGWTGHKLSAHLTANPDGIRSHQAVLRARLVDLPAPPRPVTQPSTHDLPRCEKHPEQRGNCGVCRTEKMKEREKPDHPAVGNKRVYTPKVTMRTS